MTVSTPFEIVAHRGVTTRAPENTVAAYEDAVALKVDAIEIDVRLTADGVPVVFHYFYLDEATDAKGPIFDYTLDDLRRVRVVARDEADHCHTIPTLRGVLGQFGGRIGLEIEIKGPEPEAPERIASILDGFRDIWETIEVTSYEPALLLDLQRRCPGLSVDLLTPISEPWKKLDVCAYIALHRGRLAHARAVHLHPSQMDAGVIELLAGAGMAVHGWDGNDHEALKKMTGLGIDKICTDRPQLALLYRQELSHP